ncbi:HNH endonuclease signature motif containing protein [Microbacterium sp. C7(2022)]|uniref:HNH endonuclease signature motif containing protein n=1 Tax=Microbacterium sp. C7(2022) TaxID=2992759 RepID=UPI00237BB3AC|nr:HNH endonuclease signature motif containing protein [Microbacterium sp. C7(2022)]MDE0547666.1 HNH endonuclease [Microbacterium sp. C7(2022)]
MTNTAPDPAEAAAARLAPVVAEVTELRKQMAMLQAQEARAMARADVIAEEWADAADSRSEADFAHRSVAAEFATALRVSDRTVQRQLADSTRLVERFPQTTESLEAGRISFAHARVILEAGERITEPLLIAEYEASVLPYAEAESATRLRPIAKRRAEWFLDETFSERHTAATTKRSVSMQDLDDGMAELHLVAPMVLIHGIHDRLTRMARDVADADTHAIRDAREAVKIAEQQGQDATAARAHLEALLAARRTLDAIRADLVADLLLASDPIGHIGTTDTGLGSIRASVQITVPVLSLIESPADDPFDAVSLTGRGPIDPDMARKLAAHAPGWDRVLTHPISGAVLAVDRYSPSPPMRRLLAVRDQHCRFPGCRQSAARSDIDHTIAWEHGGRTATENMAHLCRRHHTMKHHTPWSVVQKPGGVLEWTSPTGKVYPDHPSSGVYFATDAEFDPAPF